VASPFSARLRPEVFGADAAGEVVRGGCRGEGGAGATDFVGPAEGLSLAVPAPVEGPAVTGAEVPGPPDDATFPCPGGSASLLAGRT